MKPHYVIALVLGMLLVLLVLFGRGASAADLPLPKRKPERCLVAGEEPSPGQTLHVDKRCKSGLRWVYQR